METATALCFAVIALAIVAVGALAAVVVLVMHWPSDKAVFAHWLDSYNNGREQGVRVGMENARLQMREQQFPGAWSAEDPTPPASERNPDEVTVGKRELIHQA